MKNQDLQGLVLLNNDTMEALAGGAKGDVLFQTIGIKIISCRTYEASCQSRFSISPNGTTSCSSVFTLRPL